jgi:hypothetical protein
MIETVQNQGKSMGNCLKKIPAAQPTPGGLGHVNEQPHEYVIKLLEANATIIINNP